MFLVPVKNMSYLTSVVPFASLFPGYQATTTANLTLQLSCQIYSVLEVQKSHGLPADLTPNFQCLHLTQRATKTEIKWTPDFCILFFTDQG